MTDGQLTDAWQAGKVFHGGITHEQHLRIAWVLHRRHGPGRAEQLLVAGTRRACDVHGSPAKFDVELTRGGDAAKRDGFGTSAAAFLREHGKLMQGDRLG